MSKEQPTICQLVHGLPVGGAEVLVDRFVRHLRREHRVVVACLDQVGELGEALRREGVSVTHLGRSPGFDWSCVLRLARFLRYERVNIVHAHQYTPFAYATATRAVGSRPRVLFTEHGRFWPDVPSKKRAFFNRVMLRQVDRYVAVGESVKTALVHNEGLPSERIEVIYNGIDFTRLRTTHDRVAVRYELGLDSDQFVVLQVARLDPIKDHSTALMAASVAVKSIKGFRLLLAGEGPERAAIERRIAELGLRDNVEVLGIRRDVPRLLAAADAFLLTSVSEGIPLTVIEAMAAGVPAVATAVGGVCEVIDHGRTGLLAPAGDAAQLADCLSRIARDPVQRQSIIDAARSHSRSRFSEEVMFDRYQEIYDSMLRYA